MKFIRAHYLKLMTFTVVLLSMSVAHAHHSSAPHFDDEKQITVTGKFTQFKFVNPHAYLYFDVEQEGESVPWRCELQSATQLKRSGWSRDMFTEGQQLTVIGNPARREDNVCFLRTLELADGSEIARYGDLSNKAATEEPATAPAVERPKVLANGQPNLTGPWVTLSFGRGDVEGIRPQYEASAAGKEAVGDYEMAFDDPILNCHYVNLINGWNHDRHVNEIYQSEDTVQIQYGFMDALRTVHLNMDKHPENIVPSSTGHSIGSWDGDVLVVDTIGFEEGILAHRSGMKHSDQMRVVERFRYDENKKHLIRDYVMTDPLYLVGETVGQDVMALSDVPYTPYDCVELSGKNNLRPDDERYSQIDATGEIASSATQSVAEQPAAAPQPVAATPEQVEVKSSSSEINTDSGKKGGSVGLISILFLAMFGLVRRRRL